VTVPLTALFWDPIGQVWKYADGRVYGTAPPPPPPPPPGGTATSLPEFGFDVVPTNNQAEFKRLKIGPPPIITHDILWHQTYVTNTPTAYNTVTGASQDGVLGVKSLISIDNPGSDAAAQTAMSTFAATCPAGTIIKLVNEPDNGQMTGAAWVSLVNTQAAVIKAANPAVKVASGSLMKVTVLNTPSYWSGLSQTNLDFFGWHMYAHSMNPDGSVHVGWPYTAVAAFKAPIDAIRATGITVPLMCDEWAVEYDPKRCTFNQAGTLPTGSTGTIDRGQWAYDALVYMKTRACNVSLYWQHPYDPASNSNYNWGLWDADLARLDTLIAAAGG
jgi:hypothetical protein